MQEGPPMVLDPLSVNYQPPWESRPCARTTSGQASEFQPRTIEQYRIPRVDLNAFGGANFSGLNLAHLDYLRSNSVSQ